MSWRPYDHHCEDSPIVLVFVLVRVVIQSTRHDLAAVEWQDCVVVVPFAFHEPCAFEKQHPADFLERVANDEQFELVLECRSREFFLAAVAHEW